MLLSYALKSEHHKTAHVYGQVYVQCTDMWSYGVRTCARARDIRCTAGKRVISGDK